MKLGLRGKLLSTYLILISLGVGGLTLRFAFLERAQIIEEDEHALETQAYVLASAIEGPFENFSEGEASYQTFQRELRRLVENIESRFTLLTTQGDPIFDSHEDFKLIPNQLEQVEVQAALSNIERHAIRLDPLTQEERLYAAAPSHHEGEQIAIVQLSVPTAPIQARIQQSWSILAVTALVILGAVILASLWLANYILRPLLALQHAANRLAYGHLDERIEKLGNDELGDMGRAFNFMAEQLSQVITQQKQFVANASHELRTPLTNIKLRAEALRNGASEDPAVAQKFLADIEHEADHMGQLTQNLLTLARLEAKTTQTASNQTSPNLATILQDSLSRFVPLAAQKDIVLQQDLPKDLPTIQGRDEQLKQIFDNLLSNAIKYTPAGGLVSLSAQNNPNWLTIRIVDTGQGIPAEDLPHIFERFYRVDKARTRSKDPGGTGLGLAIVSELLKAQNGDIKIESDLGKGTSVQVRLARV